MSAPPVEPMFLRPAEAAALACLSTRAIYVIHDLRVNEWVLRYRELLGDRLLDWAAPTNR